MAPSEVEATPTHVSRESFSDSPAALRGEHLSVEAPADEAEASLRPTVISIDFSDALVPPDESALTNAAPLIEVTEIPPQGPVVPLRAVDSIPVQDAAADLEIAALDHGSLAAAAFAPVLVPAEEPAHEEGPVGAEVPVEAPPTTIVFVAEGRFTARPLRSPAEWKPSPESVEATPPAPPFVAPKSPPSEAATGGLPSVDSPADFEQLAAELPAESPGETGAPGKTEAPVAPEAMSETAAPVIAEVLEVPEGSAAVEAPDEVEVSPEAKAEATSPTEPSTTVEPPPLRLEADASAEEPAGAEPTVDLTPLLSLPRLFPDAISAEVLPPPALPLRRFDQDALQALFMTDEVLDLPRISRLAAQLPGVHACVIATRDQACTGGRLPEGFDLAALLGLAPRVGEAAGRMPIGSLKHFTLYGEQYSVSFFERNGLSLCAVHRPRSFVPGVREKLVAIADELSK